MMRECMRETGREGRGRGRREREREREREAYVDTTLSMGAVLWCRRNVCMNT